MQDRVEALEREVEKLDRQELRRFAEWFAEREASLWDEQIAEDAAAGRLDFLIAEAREERTAESLTDLFDGIHSRGD